jgi:glycine/serine hydroxymethyltransferase
VPGDKSAMVPGGMRIGTPALTTRGFGEAEFERVAEFIARAVEIAKDCQVRGSTPGAGGSFCSACRGKGLDAVGWHQMALPSKLGGEARSLCCRPTICTAHPVYAGL